jgi:hypothetical protein
MLLTTVYLHFKIDGNEEGGHNIEWQFNENIKKSLFQNYSENNLWQIPLDKKFLNLN